MLEPTDIGTAISVKARIVPRINASLTSLLGASCWATAFSTRPATPLSHMAMTFPQCEVFDKIAVRRSAHELPVVYQPPRARSEPYFPAPPPSREASIGADIRAPLLWHEAATLRRRPGGEIYARMKPHDIAT